MGIRGLNQAVDKQNERNQKAVQKDSEDIEMRPPHLETRGQVRKRRQGELTETEETWREGVRSMNRKREDEVDPTVARSVVWSYKGKDYEGAVEWVKHDMSPDEYISIVSVDMSNYLIPYFRRKDSQYRQRILSTSTPASRILAERRLEVARYTNSIVDDIEHDFPSADKIYLIYDNPTWRPDGKERLQSVRLGKPSVAKASSLSTAAILDRRKDPHSSDPPQINMSGEEYVSLPAHIPPTTEEMYPPLPCFLVEESIAIESRRLADRAHLVVAAGEADFLCRDLLARNLLPGDPRISSYSFPTSINSPPLAPPPPTTAWSSRVDDLQSQNRPLHLILGVDTDHAGLNDHTTCHYIISRTESLSRATSLRKRHLHPEDWQYSNYASSTMGMVLTSCDHYDGLPFFTLHGVGTRKDHARELPKKEQQEDVLFDICEHALEWRNAYYELFKSPSRLVSVTIGGRTFDFVNSVDLVNHFAKLVKPLFRPTKNIPKFDMNLHDVISIFDGLYGEVDVLVNKSELEKKIEQDLETLTNARLKENYTTPGLRNHCYSSLISPPRIPKRPAALSPPIVRPRRRASSLPPSQHFGEPSSSLHTSASPQNPSTNRITSSPKSPPSPLSKSIPIRRRHSFSAPSTTSPSPPRPRHYQLREGSDGGAHLRGTLSALDKWKKALEQQQKGEGDEGEDANPRPLKKRRFIKSKKGKGKERARGDGDENEGDETKEGEGTSSRAKGVGAGVKDLGLALSAVTYPNRISSFNNLIIPGIQTGTRFDYSLHLSLNNLLNLWISESPATLELVGLLTSLYTEFSPVLLEQLIGQGGQHFASVASLLVQRTAKFYEKNPLEKELQIGEHFTTESAPQWLKKKYDAIVGYVPEDRRTKLWDLIDALRFVEKDFESFGKRNEYNLFGLIVVKIRRFLRYSPPIISQAKFVELNFTTCGTSYSNALILRGRRLHRTAATALVDHLADFCSRSPSSPYSASDAALSQLFHSLSPVATSLLEKMSRKRLKRLVSLQVYHSYLPDLTSISNEPVVAPTGDDSEEEEEEEEDSDSESEGMNEDVLLSFVKEMDAAKEDSDVEMEEEDPEDSDYEFPEEEEDTEEVNLQQEVGYDEFGSRIFRTIRNGALRQTSSLLRSTELNDASHELARLFISGTRVASAMIGASIVEGVRHSPDSDVFKGCRTVGDVIMAAGGKEEKLWKDEKFFETREEEEAEEIEIEVGEESKFKRSAQLSMVMRISAELWSLTGLPPLNFEPDGYHFTARLLRNFTNPGNQNYLPNLLEQLWERNEIESLEFNRLFSLRTPPDRISPFEFPSALPDSAPSASRHAVQFLNSLRQQKDSSFLRLQKSKSKFTLFPVLHDWPRLDYDELPSNGPLPLWRLNDRGRAQLRERSQAVFALFEHLGLTSDEDCEQVEQELWRYIIKPSPGSGKLHRGNIYVTREKVISLVGDLTRYNKTAYSRLPTSTTQPMNCLATAEYLISRQPKVIPVYRKLEARRAAYQQQTGKVELIEVQSVEVKKVRFKEVQKKETTPFPPILRIHAEPNTTTGPPRISLSFVQRASPSTSRPPRVDDRMPLRLSLTTPPSNGRGPSDNERWSEFVTEVIEPRATLPPKEELPASSDSRRAEPHSPVNAATSSAPRSPLPFVTSQTPLASTSKALLPPSSDESLSNHSVPTSSRTETHAIPLFAASSTNSEQNRLRLDSTGAGAERVGRDWKEETRRWLTNKYWTRPSPFIVSSDPGRVYSLVSAQVGTREGKIKFHRTKSSAERVRERHQNAMLAELARWESRRRLSQALQAPGSTSTSTSTDLSLLLRRSANPSTPSRQLPAASSSPLSREWFPSQTISIPPPLQGALIHSPDYLHAQANRAEQLRRTAERQSNAAKQWREALPRPLDGSSIKVGIVKAKGNISGGRGYGCQNSGEIQEWMIRGVKSLPWVDCLVVECSEGYTSQVCSRPGCYATLVHPTRTGDPSFSELLRLHVCVRCWEVSHRDDDGALNLGAVALGIAKVGKGNFLAPEVAKLMRNKNRLSPRKGKMLSTRLWKLYNHLDEPSRARTIMDLKASSDLVQLMLWVQSNSADDQAEETLQDEEDDRVDE